MMLLLGHIFVAIEGYNSFDNEQVYGLSNGFCLYATSGGSAYYETGAATNNFGVVRWEIFHEKRGLETRLTRYGQGKGWLAMAFKNSSSY
jgi:hypothetical protein